MFYSKSTGGFYTIEIHGDAIPVDAVELTDTEHAALLAAQSSGKIIQADANGNPVAVDAPAPTTVQLWAAYRVQAQSMLDKSDVTMIRCVENSVSVPSTWTTYRHALRAIVGATSGDPAQPLPTRPAYPSGT